MAQSEIKIEISDYASWKIKTLIGIINILNLINFTKKKQGNSMTINVNFEII